MIHRTKKCIHIYFQSNEFSRRQRRFRRISVFASFSETSPSVPDSIIEPDNTTLPTGVERAARMKDNNRMKEKY